jgi:glycosyltransferase 2 family protein
MKRKWLFQAIGIIIFVFILWKLDIKAAIALLADTRLSILALALVLTVPFVLIKAWRWKYLLRMQGIDYHTRDCFYAYLSAMYLGLVTPGRVGDFVKVVYLKKDKQVAMSRGVTSVIVDRLFDLLLYVTMACAGGLAFALSGDIMAVIFAFVLLFIAILLIFVNKTVRNLVLGTLFRILLPKKAKEGAEVRIDSFYRGVDQFRSFRLVVPLLLTLLTYVFFYAQCYLIAIAVNIPISFMNVVYCISTANLVSLLPISVSGIGTRDATLISMFAVLDIPKESAVVFSILFLFISNVSSCLIGAVAWFKKPVEFKTW